VNIFAVDHDPVAAAVALHDKHVVKMVLETAQMLCTIGHRLGIGAPYKPTHGQHPCTVWAASSRDNAAWLVAHGNALCAEYTRRFRREHASQRVIREVAAAVLPLLPAAGRTPFAQAVPDDCRDADPVAAYRAYYRQHKLEGARYTNSSLPAWA
jgi:hypothetical protein